MLIPIPETICRLLAHLEEAAPDTHREAEAVLAVAFPDTDEPWRLSAAKTYAALHGLAMMPDREWMPSFEDTETYWIKAD